MHVLQESKLQSSQDSFVYTRKMFLNSLIAQAPVCKGYCNLKLADNVVGSVRVDKL